MVVPLTVGLRDWGRRKNIKPFCSLTISKPDVQWLFCFFFLVHMHSWTQDLSICAILHVTRCGNCPVCGFSLHSSGASNSIREPFIDPKKRAKERIRRLIYFDQSPSSHRRSADRASAVKRIFPDSPRPWHLRRKKKTLSPTRPLGITTEQWVRAKK